MLALRAVNLNLADEDEGLRAAFDKFDSNKSGKLDHKELRKALGAVKLEMDSEGAKGLVAKYDEDQSGMMEFDEFKKLAMALSAVNVKIDDPKAVEAALANRKEKTKKSAPPVSASSSTPMLASKLSGEDETLGAKPMSAPTAAPAPDEEDDEYEYYAEGDESAKEPAKPELAKKPEDDDEYEYYDGEDEVVPVVKK